jgi:RHS repeat-associated protein/uncharacterized repeat protein (TIGR01451 family)
MAFHTLRRILQTYAASSPARRRPRGLAGRQGHRRRLRVERLEERIVMSTDTWTGLAGDGNWATAGNWSNGVPTSSSDVVINGNVTVGHASGSDSINTLTVGTGATLQITGNSAITTLAQGAAGPVTQVQNDGTIALGDSGGPSSGSLIVDATSGSIAGRGTFNLGSNAGNVLQEKAGETLTIGTGLSVNATNGVIGNAAGVLNNQATITGTAATGSAVDVELGGANGTGSNTGTITDPSGFGELDVSGGFTNTGTISSTGGLLLKLGSASNAWTNTGTISSNGIIALEGAITQAGIGTLTRQTGSTVWLSGTLTGGLSLDATTGSWELVGGTLSGAVTGSSGSVLSATQFGGTLNGVSLDATNALDLAFQLGAVVHVVNGLTLSGTTINIGSSTGTTSASLLFDTATSNLLGTGTINLGNNAGNQLELNAGGTLTIASGIRINAMSGTIGNALGVLNNQATITTNAPVSVVIDFGASSVSGTNSGTLQATSGNLNVVGTLANSGTISIIGGGWLRIGTGTGFNWSNTGTIRTTSSTVYLDGYFTQAGLGTFIRDSASTINLTGTLSGGLSLGASTGTWFFDGGMLSGGALTTSNGNDLLIGMAGVLSGIALDSSNALDMQSFNGANLFIQQSLTLNGATLQVGSSSGTTSAILDFDNPFGGATISLNGSGTIDLGSNAGNALEVTARAPANTLAIGAGITINAANGQIGLGTSNSINGFLINNQGTIDAAAAAGQTVTVYLGSLGSTGSNSGTIQATSGNLAVVGPFTNATTIGVAGGATLSVGSPNEPWDNTGTIHTAGSTVDLSGTFTQAALGTFLRDSSSTVNLTGTLTGGLSLGPGTGSWLLAGGTLSGGTLTTSDPRDTLVATSSGGQLTDVTLDGTGALDVQSINRASLELFSTCTLNDTTVQIGNAGGTTQATLFIQATLSGSGAMDLGPNSRDGILGSFTLPSGITIAASGGQVGSFNASVNNQSVITADAPAGATVTVNLGGQGGQASGSNTGTIHAKSGDLAILGGFTNSGTICIASGGTLDVGVFGTWTNNGTVAAQNGSTVLLDGTLTNFTNGTLAGGDYEALGDSTIYGFASGIATDDTTTSLVLDGANSHFYVGTTGTTDALASLGSINLGGSLTLQNGATFTPASGSLSNDGTLTIGPGSQLTVSTYTQFLGGTYVAELGGASSSQYGQLAITGSANLGGAVTVSLVHGFVPAEGDIFTILTFGAQSGVSVTVNLPSVSGAVLQSYFQPTSLSLLTLPAGTTVYWVGGSGDWDTSSNWSTGQVPTPSDHVAIVLPNANVTHSQGTFDAVASLVSFDPIDLTAGTLSLAGPSAMNSNLTLGGATITGAGSLTLAGASFNWNGGALSLGGTVTLAPTEHLDLTIGSLDGTLDNQGTATWLLISFVGGPIIIGGAGTFVNDTGASFQVQATQGQFTQGPLGIFLPSFTNAPGATFNYAALGIVTFNHVFSNAGVVQDQVGPLSLPIVPQLSQGTLTGGSWVVAPGGSLDLNSGVPLTTIGGSASVALLGTGATFANLAGPAGGPGSLTNDGSLTLGPGATLHLTSYTQDSGGTLAVEIGGTPASGQFGQLVVGGPATLDGMLDIRQANGFTASTGQVFQVMTFNQVSGDFATYGGLAPTFTITLDPTDLLINTLVNSVDLGVVSITAPMSAAVGQPIPVSWQVLNTSPSFAIGTWQDSVYLSATPTITPGSILLGSQVETGGLSSDGRYVSNLTATVPALAPGNYYVIVQVDGLNQLPDSNRANNTFAMLSPLAVSVPALALDTPTSDAFSAADQDRYYQVTVPAGGTLLVSLQSNAASGSTALYISKGTLPTVYNYQEAATIPNQPNQTVAVPQVLAAGTYYVLAHSVSGAAATAGFGITATQTSALSVSAISSYAGGNAGNVTVEIDGANFTPGTTANLTLGGTTIPYTAIDFVSASQLYATFNLKGAVPGNYTLGVQQGLQSATASALFQVEAAKAAPLNVVLITPQSVQVGRTGTVVITYTNQSDNDLVAPLLTISSTDPKVSFSTPGNPNNYTQSAQVLAVASQGPAGILRPGQSGQLTLNFLSNDPASGGQIPVRVDQIAAGQTIDWTSLQTVLQPAAFSSAAWNVVFANVVSLVGTTTDSYNAALAQAATYLASVGETAAQVSDVSRLWSFLVSGANAAFPTSTLSSAVDASLPVPGKLPLAIDRTFVGSVAGRYHQGIFGPGWVTSWQANLSVDDAGNVTISSGAALQYFVLQANGTYLTTDGEYGTLTRAGGIFTFTSPSEAQYVYRSDGRLNYVQDTNDNRITLGYDASNELVTLTYSNPSDPPEPTAQLTLSYTQGLVTQVADGTGNIWTYQYDGAGRLLSVTAPGNLTTIYTYDTGTSAATLNALMSITNPDGSQQNFSYDSQGRLASTSQTGGAQPITYTYSGTAQVTATDLSGDQTTVSYNDLGLPARVVNPLGAIASYLYDTNGNLVAYTDAAGSTYQYSYDSQGNLIQSVSPLGQMVQLSYGSFGNLTSYTDADSNTTAYRYDAAGNLRGITYRGGEQQSFTYDPLGNLTDTVEQNGHAVGFQRNAAGQVTQETFADGSSQTFTYDAHGNLLTAETFSSAGTPTGTTTLTYNAANELLSITYPNGLFLDFTYDPATGQRTKSVDQDGFTIQYQYDTQGRLIGLTDGSNNPIVQYTYNSLGQLAQKQNGNGTYTTYTYDAAGELTGEVNYAGGTTVNSSFTYTYNVLGEVASVTDNANNTTQYAYDAIGELTQVTLPSGQTIGYVYNAAGDRTQVTTGGTTVAVSSNADNEITQVGSTHYAYDPNGNLTGITDANGTSSFTYNDLNQLVSIAGADGTTTTLQYSPLGSLIGSSVNGTQTNYVVDPTGPTSIVGASNGSGPIAKYVYGLGLVSQTGPAGTGYYDFDVSGNTTGITGNTGSYVNQYSYLPFGETTPSPGTLANPFTFGGQGGVLQVGTDVFSMRARFYTPQTGQFLSNDPLGLGGGDTNLRRYVLNAVVNFVDYLGLSQARNGSSYNQYINQLFQPDASTANTAASPLASESYYVGLGFNSGQVPPPNPNGPITGNVRSHSSIGGGGGAAAGAQTNTAGGLTGGGSTTNASTNQLKPSNPQSIQGPAGVGAQNVIQPAGTWSYTTTFTNTGTTPAGMVVITEQLASNLDFSTFQLGSFGFATLNVAIPAGLTAYQTSVASRSADGTSLTVTASFNFNVQTGLLTVILMSLDPLTGKAPLAVGAGFLPSDDTQGDGKGFVQYTIQPRVGLNSGSSVQQEASVVFDGKAPVNTNVYTNTINSGHPADHLVIQLPSQTVAGGQFGVTVAAEGANGQFDTLYNGSVALLVSSGPAGGALSGVTVAPVVNGVATFGKLSLNALGNYTLLAASTTALLNATGSISLVAAPHFTVSAAPSPINAGQVVNVTITVLGPNNQPDTAYLGTIQITSTDPHAGLPANATFQPGNNGQMTVPVTLRTAGKFTITATDVTLPTLRATSSAVTVNAGTVSGFTIEGFPSATVSGVSHPFTVTATDAFGNRVRGYGGTVQFTLSGQVRPSSYTFTAKDQGAHPFTGTFTAIGANQSLTVTDQANNALTGSETGINVASPATHLSVTVTGQTTSSAGHVVQITVTALTGAGHTDTLFPDMFHFVSSDKQAILPVDQSLAGRSGTATFAIILKSSGRQTITVTDLSRGSIPSGSAAFTVSPLAATQLALSVATTPALFGVADTVTVTAEDRFGNRVTKYSGAVQPTLSGGTASLPSSLTMKSPSATFKLTPQSLGSLTLQATDGTNRGSLPFTVISAARRLHITGIPSSITAGQPFTITISALNAANAPTVPFTDVLHFTDKLGNTGLPADAPFSGTGGQEQFTLTLPNAGRQTITVTDVTDDGVQAVFLTDTVGPAKNSNNLSASLSGPAVGVPGQPLTFTLTASETGAAAGAVYTYHIDWGNGATQTVSGPSGQTVSHTYSATGNFTAKVTAVDAAGAASTQAGTHPVSITTTALENDPATNTLAIGCARGGATVVITPTNGAGTDVAVTINGATQTLPSQPFTHLFIFGQTGKVVVQEVAQTIGSQSVSVTVPAIIVGGSGTNTLSVAGSSANNVLVGGTGSSSLTGGSGQDILIGGGAAVLHAGSGGDLLIGGSTTYDANLAALLALVQEWGRTDISYAQRVQDLSGSGSVGQNGAIVLTAQTIARDTALSQLFGGAGPNWFWLSESKKSSDRLSNYTSGELVSFD